MTKRAAPAGVTGGEGFNYEDRVAARALLDLLRGSSVLGPEFGRPTAVHWQARDRGWRLDDLALAFRGPDGRRRVAGVSVKRHRYVTAGGFAAEFARACWEQWRGGPDIRRLRRGRDALVLVTGSLSDDARTAWADLLSAAGVTADAPDRLVTRMQPGSEDTGQLSSETQRGLFRSLRCPEDLAADPAADTLDAARLVRHVRLLSFDFGRTPSADLDRALADARGVVVGGGPAAARRLWNELVALSAWFRGRAGSTRLPRLVSHLRAQGVRLADYPDDRADWARLDAQSRERMAGVGATVGDAEPLARPDLVGHVRAALRAGGVCVLVGESGAGKSALARLAVGARRPVWLTADQLAGGRSAPCSGT